MGGTINIAARFNDGEAICIDGWTNFIPNMVMNDTTLSGDDSVVRETLLEVANHQNYDGPQPFRASGYGIVVIDFIDKTIHSMQGYTNFSGDRMLAHFMDFNQSGWKGEGQIKGMEKFLESGDLSEYKVIPSEEGRSLIQAQRLRLVSMDGERVEPRAISEQEMVDLIRENTGQLLKSEGKGGPFVEVDITPFIVIDYPENTPLTSMKNNLRKAGFPLTKAEGLNAMLKNKETA